MTDSDLATLLATRICHDLASPVGATANLADMVQAENGDAPVEDLRLLHGTAQRAASMLKLYRLSFGPSSQNDRVFAASDLATILTALAIEGKISVSLMCDRDHLAHQTAKITGLMAIAGRSIVGLRGSIDLEIGLDATRFIVMRANGPRCALPVVKHDLLSGQASHPTTPDEIEFALIRSLGEAQNLRLSVTEASETVRLLMQP